MKKNLVLLLLITVLLIPLRVNAGEVISNTIIGDASVKTDTNTTYKLNVNVSELDASTDVSMGIYLIAYELEFDPEVFAINSVTAKGFDTTVSKQNNKYYVVSIVNDTTADNKCHDGFLYCGVYTADISLYVKNTDKTSSTLKINDLGVGLVDVRLTNFSESDIVEIDASVASKAITISKPAQPSTNNNNNNYYNSYTPKPSTPSTTTKSDDKKTEKPVETIVDKKSSNNYLEYINIEGYNINYDRLTNTYSIKVPKNVNELDIRTKTEDANAKYSIKGADDLKENDYTVIIEVVAENGNKNIYIINVKTDEMSSSSSVLFAILVISGGILMALLIAFIAKLVLTEE